jgi:hypothetical protein
MRGWGYRSNEASKGPRIFLWRCLSVSSSLNQAVKFIAFFPLIQELLPEVMKKDFPEDTPADISVKITIYGKIA